ncbi:MAG TPA: GntR family transcriptional regulator [Chloroflexota bacterium]|nr:GntR family transcriptional regulator [Chloroflexota bacterium]
MNEAVFSSLRQNTLRISALTAIRDNILNGTLRPGQQLVQAEIAAQMKVSRAPVREALRHLEDEGLVESIPYRGTFVSRVTRRDVIELYSLRGALEALAVRLIIQAGRDADIVELEGILSRMSGAAELYDDHALNDADIEFHTRLCYISGHRHLIRSWEMNSNQIRRVLSLRNKLSPHRVVVEMHHPIVEAIRVRDESAGGRAVDDHCIDSGNALAAIWPEDGAGYHGEVL